MGNVIKRITTQTITLNVTWTETVGGTKPLSPTVTVPSLYHDISSIEREWKMSNLRLKKE